jgi:hypothetical protein
LNAGAEHNRFSAERRRHRITGEQDDHDVSGPGTRFSLAVYQVCPTAYVRSRLIQTGSACLDREDGLKPAFGVLSERK